MCGIIAVVRRPSDAGPPPRRRPPRSADAHAELARLADAPRRLARRSTRWPAAVGEVDACLRGVAGRARRWPATRRCSSAVDRTWRRLLDADVARHRGRARPSEADGDAAAGDRARGRQRRADRAQGRGVGGRSATACARRARCADLAGPDARPAPPSRLPVDPAGALGPRPARGARPRLGRPARARAGPRPRPATGGGGRARWPPGADDPLFASGAVRVADGRLGFVYKAAAEIGELGDNTAGAARRPSAATTLLRRALAGADGRRPSVLGHTRWASVGHHLRAQRPPAQLRGARTGADGPVRRRPCSTATSTTSPTSRPPRRCASRPRSPPTPRSSRRSCRASSPTGDDLVEAFRAHASPRSRARSPSAPARPPTPDRPAAGAARQRPGALRRAGRGRLHRGQRALRRGRGDRRATCAWTARRRPTPTTRAPAAARSCVLDGAAAGTLEGIERLAYDGTALPVVADELADGRDHHPRHRPRRRPRTSCSRRSPRRRPRSARPCGASSSSATAACSVRARRRHAARRRCAGDLRDRVDPPGPRHRPGHRRGGRPEPGRGAARRSSAATAVAVEAAAGHRAVRLRAARRHVRHAGRRRQPVGHHHRHQPHRRPGAGARRRGGRHRQPAQQRPHRQGRRRALHLRRPRRRDERRLDQGVLRPDRRRLPARPAPSPTRPALRPGRRRVDAAAGRAARAARRDATHALEPARRASPRPPSGCAPSRRYWAIVGNGANRVAADEVRIKLSELCYKSIACDATEDKKHIDLSSEPLILVCAAGLAGSTADDVAKEVAIYRAHKAAPIVIATEGEERFAAALQAVLRAGHAPRRSPSCCRPWSATCSATRRRWPSTPRPGRCARPGPPSRRRSSPPATAADGADLLDRLRAEPRAAWPPASSTGCAAGDYDGHLEASTAVRLASLLRYAAGRAARSRRTRSSTARSGTPERGGRGPDRRADPGHRGAHPARSTPSSTRPRPSPSASPAATRACSQVAAGARRCSAPAPARDRLSYRVAADPGRRSTRPSTEVLGLHPLPHRGRVDDERRPASVVVVDRGGIARELAQPHRAQARAAWAPSTAWPSSARCTVAAGRSDGRTRGASCPRSRTSRRPASRCCTCASRDRLPAGRHAGGARRATGAGYDGPEGRGHRDRAHLPRRPARPTARGRPAHRAGQRPGRPLALRACADGGLTSRARDRGRHRRRPGRPRPVPPGRWPARPPSSSGSSPTASRPTRERRHDPTERFGARFAAKEAVMKALGVGLGEVRFRELEVARMASGAPVLELHGAAAELAASAGRRRLAAHADPHRPPGPGRGRWGWGRSGVVIPVVTPDGDGRDRPGRARAGRGADRPGRAARWPGPRSRLLGGTYGRRVVVVAGKGNNGNDGREAARRLAPPGRAGRGGRRRRSRRPAAAVPTW